MGMRRLLLVISVLLSVATALGQNVWEKGRDSLLNALHQAKTDSGAAKTMIYLAAQYAYNNQDSGLFFSRQAYQVSKRTHYVWGMVNGLSQEAGILADQFKLIEAIALDSEAIVLSTKANFKRGLAGVYNNIAIAYNRLGQDATSIDYYLKAIAMDEELNERYNTCMGYSNIAGVYMDMKEYNKGYSNALKGIELARKVGYTSAIESGEINLGSALIKLKRTDTALIVLNEVKGIAKELHDYDIVDEALNDICAIYMGRRQLEQLRTSATELLDFARAVKEQQGIFYGLGQLYFYYLLKKQYTQAADYSRQMTAYATDKKENRWLDDSYEDAAVLRLAQGDLDGYYKNHDLEDSMDGLLLSDKIVKNTQEMEARYSLHEKQSEIEDLQKQHRIQELELREQRLMNILLGGVVAVIVLIGFLYRRNYRQKKGLMQADALLKQQRITELEKEKQLLAVEAVLKGQVEERSRLAKDLHDGLGSILSGVKYSFANMKDNLIITAEGAEAFERSMGMLDKSIHELRRVAHNMMPEALMKFGLDTALRDFCQSIDGSGAIKLTYLSIDVNEASIPETHAAAVYRIVQELVNNILKHAGATTALVQLIRKENALSITVEDDGKGFDAAVLEKSDGIGWLNLKNRVAWLNGTIDIHTEAGKGASVNIEIPNITT
jgi:two-component system, NarL family, sensor kinase